MTVRQVAKIHRSYFGIRSSLSSQNTMHSATAILVTPLSPVSSGKHDVGEFGSKREQPVHYMNSPEIFKSRPIFMPSLCDVGNFISFSYHADVILEKRRLQYPFCFFIYYFMWCWGRFCLLNKYLPKFVQSSLCQ